MDFADLRPRPEGNGVAQTGWSGCAPLEADWAFASAHNIIASLPRRQSSYRSLYFRLRKAAAPERPNEEPGGVAPWLATPTMTD